MQACFSRENLIFVDLGISADFPRGGGGRLLPISMTAPLPPNESRRLEVLRAYDILDSGETGAFDEITALAAQVCGTPVALITLLDGSRQWCKSRINFSREEMPREESFCAHALAGGGLLVVPDALADPRFRDSPLVTGEEGIRFYAGAPLVASGEILGTLCVMDRVPREMEPPSLLALEVLSRQVMTQIQSLHDVRALKLTEAALIRMLDERELGEDQQRRLVEKLTVAQEIGKVGSWETDVATLQVAWSAQTHRIFETDVEVFRPNHPAFLEFVHPDDRDAVEEAFVASLEKTGPCSIQHRIIMPDGRVKHLEERWQTFRGKDGKAERVVGTCQDITARKLAEDERDRLFNLSLDMLCVANFKGRFEQVNPAWTECLGWTAEELTSSPMSEFIHPDDHEATARTREFIVAGNPVRGFENRYRRKDGTYRWLSWNVHPLQGAGRVFSVARDVTERKEADEALRASEAMMATAQGIAHFGSWEWDLTQPVREEAILRWSDEMFRIMGLGENAAEIRHRDFLDLVHVDDRDALALASGRIVREGGEYTIIYRVIRPDGGERIVHEMARVFFHDQTGAPLRMVGTTHDITEKRKAEQTLQESESRFRELADNISEVFWIRDPRNGGVLYVSPAYEKIWGLPCEGLYRSQHTWLDTIHPEDRGRVHTAASRVAGGQYDEIYRIIRPDRTIRWIHDRAYPVREEHGEVHQMVGTAEDITERKNLEQQFLRAQRMDSIGSLAAGIAHDLNNVLAPILMSIEMLRPRLADVRSREIIELIGSSARRGTDMVSRVLSFARGLEGIRAPVAIDRLVEDVARIVGETFPRDVRLVTELGPDLLTPEGDLTQLHQVILNLCVNARDAMPSGGTIRLRAMNVELDGTTSPENPVGAAGPYVRIRVEDTGCGMPDELMEKIFDPFFTTKEAGKGTGLGLSSVLAIVKGHGGFVTVSSRQGEGSCFSIHLPAIPASAAAAVPVAAVPNGLPLPHGDGQVVLVVDDEPAVCEITRRILEAHGYGVLVAQDGTEAVSCYIANGQRISLVLTDMNMPHMDGISLIHVLRRLDPRVRVIVASGIRGADLQGRARVAGAVDFLPKPITADALLHAMHKALAG